MVHINTVCTWLRTFVASSALLWLRPFWGGTLGQHLLVGDTQTFLRTRGMVIGGEGFYRRAVGAVIDQDYNNMTSRLQRWSFFSNDAMVMFFFRAPLPTMVFQWFRFALTITIECFFADWPLTSMVFQWFYPNSDTMVSNGFGYEKTKNKA